MSLIIRALVAQWLEQHSYKVLAVGSIPIEGTVKGKYGKS
jgi:hypothetical protein